MGRVHMTSGNCTASELADRSASSPLYSPISILLRRGEIEGAVEMVACSVGQLGPRSRESSHILKFELRLEFSDDLLRAACAAGRDASNARLPIE